MTLRATAAETASDAGEEEQEQEQELDTGTRGLAHAGCR